MSAVDSIRIIKDEIKPTLWLLPYDQNQIDSSALYHLLAKNQQQRFNKLRSKRKIEFGVTRLFLQYCFQRSFQQLHHSQQEPFEVIEKESLPPLITIAEQMKLDFNISHSKQLIAIIIAKVAAKNSGWGLDIEQYRPIRNAENAKLFCNASQLSILNNASVTEYDEHYYRFWTQKEAVLKAKRSGIIDTDLRTIEGIPSQENQHLRCSHYINPLDKKTYAISVFCQENTELINCQIVTLDESLQFSSKQTINLQWQHYRLNT